MKVLAVLAVLAAATAVLFYEAPGIGPDGVRAFIDGFGPAAPIVFIAICVVKPVLFFLPSMGLTVVAGALFGPVYGTIYVALGGAGSTVVGFYFARGLGRRSIEKFISNRKRLFEMDGRMEREGFKTVLILRLLNLPWDLVSYSAGLSGVRFKDFYLGSLVMLLPTSFLYTYFGSSIGRPLSAGFILSLALIIAFGALPHIVKRIRHAGK